MQTTIKRTYNVNRLVQIEALTGMVFQAESGGHLFQISGIDNAGEAVALSGTVSGVFLRPDNTDVALAGSVSGGVVFVPLKAECYAVPGRFGLTLYISAGGNKTAIYAAMGTVSRTSSGQVAPTVTADVVDLVNRIAAAVNSIPATYTDFQADIAPTYSDTAVYAVGQFAWYNGELKRCKTPITTPETYTAAHWGDAVLGNDLNADITGLKSASDKNYAYENYSNIWHSGGLTADRGISYTATNRIYSNELSDDVRYIKIASGYLFALYAYDGSGYVGVWNGESYGKAAANIHWISDGIFITDDYKHRINIKKTDNADISTDDGINASFGFTTDKTLSIEDKAADAKKVGDEIASLAEKIQTEKKVSNSSSFVTNIASNNFFGIIVPRFVSGYYNIPGIGAVVDVSEPVEYSTLFAALFEIPDGYTIYVDGIQGSRNARAYAYLDEDYKVISRSAEDATIDATYMTTPDNARYLIIQTKSLDKAYIVCYSGFTGALKNQYSEINSLITDYSVYKTSDGIINALRNWVRGAGYSGCFIPLGNGYDKNITVVAGSANAQVSFLTSDVAGNHNAAVNTFADGETARHIINANTTSTLKAPTNCNYVFVALISGGNYIGPESISISMVQNIFSKAIEELSAKESDDDTEIKKQEIDVTRAIGLNNRNHDIPQNRGVLNAYKRIHQLNDIAWTALSAIPGHYSSDEIPAGDHVGLPYSEAKEYDKHVGFDVSIKTFMTAAHNPYSLLYTEDINAGNRSRSAYGITYNGLNCGAYFGIVCSVYSLFGVGAYIPWKTTQFAYLNRIGKLEKAYDQTSYGLRLMDIVWEPGHCCIITDIERDDFGKPTYIYWGESIGYFPIIHKYTFEESENRLNTKGGIIYYVPDLYKRLEYSPSEFVSVADEDPIVPYAYNDDICTYAGDYASFYEGEDIYINYNAGNYTQLKVYKNGTLLNTTAIDSALHAVLITTDGYGLYTATLSDGTNESEATHFEIVQANVSCTYSGGKLKVNFSSANGTPLYGQICYRSGVTRGIIELTETDIQRGYFECEPLKVVREQLWSQATFEETTYVKVFFKGQYGTVRNDFVDTGIYP